VALSGHANGTEQCPLSGAKRTYAGRFPNVCFCPATDKDATKIPQRSGGVSCVIVWVAAREWVGGPTWIQNQRSAFSWPKLSLTRGCPQQPSQ